MYKSPQKYHPRHYFASFSCGRSFLLAVKQTLIPFNLHTQFILKCPCRYAWSSKLEAVNYTVKKERERKKKVIIHQSCVCGESCIMKYVLSSLRIQVVNGGMEANGVNQQTAKRSNNQVFQLRFGYFVSLFLCLHPL